MLEKIVEPLLEWYSMHARILPWREDASSYRVWVSEIMLQQTRVEAVKPFFSRFISALPNISDLADCEEDQLLKLWEGLGYYNRVRNMQKAAKVVMKEYNGQLPADYEELLKLPGIGPYTAGAVGSIAYNLPVPAVDGNVLRVISRVLAVDDDIMKASVRTRMENDMKAIIPQEAPGAFNQSLMELGATICVPNGVARCEACPLVHVCEAKRLNLIQELPRKTPKKPRRIEDKTVLVIRDGDKVAIRKRPKKGLLSGLYELPNIEGHLSEAEVLALLNQLNYVPLHIQSLEESKHIFSHVEWRMIGYVIKVEEMELSGQQVPQWFSASHDSDRNQDMTDMIFVAAKESEDKYAIPAAFCAYAKYMNIRLGQEKYQK